MSREQSDITRVDKREGVYTIKGVSKGKHASFHIDAPTLESMPQKQAEEFMRRSIHNLTHNDEE